MIQTSVPTIKQTISRTAKTLIRRVPSFIHTLADFGSNTGILNIDNDSYLVSIYKDDKVINGGKYYNEIYPSQINNETYNFSNEPLCDKCLV